MFVAGMTCSYLLANCLDKPFKARNLIGLNTPDLEARGEGGYKGLLFKQREGKLLKSE